MTSVRKERIVRRRKLLQDKIKLKEEYKKYVEHVATFYSFCEKSGLAFPKLVGSNKDIRQLLDEKEEGNHRRSRQN